MGTVLGARILGEIGDDRTRFATARGLKAFAGRAPISSWFIVGGTSVASPCFAGVVAIADQVNGAPLGFLNNALYKIGANPARYASDFFDITTGNNDLLNNPQDPNYAATTGWDPVTGLGTPNAANLVPDLIAAVHGN